MGYEMGNNNTTGLKEEENLSTVEDQKQLLSKDIIPSIDDVTHDHVSVEKQTLNKEVKEESGDLSLYNSPVVKAGPNKETGEKNNENQQALLATEVEDDNLIDLNIDEVVLGSNSEDQPEKLDILIKKDENEITNSTFEPISTLSSSPSPSQESEKLADSENDKEKPAPVLDDELSLLDTIGSPGGIEQISPLDYLPETEVLEDLEVRSDTESEKKIEESLQESEEEKVFCEDDISIKASSDLVKKSDQGSIMEVSLIGEESSESGKEITSVTNSPSSQQIQVTEEKTLVLSKNDLDLSKPQDESVSKSETDESKALQSERKNVEQKDIVKVVIEPEKIWEDFEDNTVISTQFENVSSEPKNADNNSSLSSSEKKMVEVEADQHFLSSQQEPNNEPNIDSKSLIIKKCVEKPEVTPLETKALSRESTDSDRDSVQYVQMRKSPSFSLDLKDEQTPLLYQDKAEIQSSPICQTDHNVSIGIISTLPVDEKVVTLKDMSEEKEESDDVSSSIKVTISSSSSSKAKEKRKVKSSLFGTCLCCTTVIH